MRVVLPPFSRYPRSAARAVKSCARRHADSKGGGDSCPFPVHAGDITRVIADLLSLPRQQQSQSPEGAAGGSSVSASEGDTGVVVESADARALRLAALPAWPLLGSPHAFQEAFSCAVLVMEAAHAVKARGGQHVGMRVRCEASWSVGVIVIVWAKLAGADAADCRFCL